MPSPVGHALAGVAVGWFVQGRRGRFDRRALLTASAYALVAALPDLDLLLPTHRGPSHGIGGAVVAGLAAWAVTRRPRTGVAFALAYGSHIFLDWLGTDTTPPIGLMAVWPFSREYYESPYHVFMAVSRRYWLPEFWTYNFRVLMRELLILAPLVIAAGLLRRPRERGTAVLVACTLLHTAAVADASAQEQGPYRDAVARYRGGEFEAAVKALSALSASNMEEETRLLERTPFGTLAADEVPTAIMLHTEAHFESAAGQIANLPAPHLDRARRLARRCLELLDAAPIDLAVAHRSARGSLERIGARQFVRQWYLLLASQFQGLRHVSRSAQHLQEARSLFPDDPDILLASGSHHEMLTLAGRRVAAGRKPGTSTPDRATSGAEIAIPLFNETGDKLQDVVIDRQTALAEAARYCRAALAANPGLYEAQLRLGRTLYLLGDPGAAAQELDAMRTRATQSALTYLASLFLALILEDRGDRRGAAELYADAMKAFPTAQAAYVGSSELLYADAQPDQAADTMKTLLERPAPRDPWWSYQMGEWWHFDARLAALRSRVRR
jgi:inner membrane protein